MNRKLLFVILCASCVSVAMGDNTVKNVEEKVEQVEQAQNKITRDVKKLKGDMDNNSASIRTLQQKNRDLSEKVDSLSNVAQKLEQTQNSDRDTLSSKIKDTNEGLALNQSAIASRTLWGIVIAILVIGLIVAAIYFISRKIKKGASSIEATIDNVRKAQDTLQTAQTKLQEDSVKLDSELLQIAQRQINAQTKEASPKPNAAPDHSLALKVADEIVRIELNMSRMDPSIKGYKQLKKAVERIKDNFKANGYDFVEMLGMPYNEGMKVIANFVSDESLEPGKQIITGITKPQINYNGKMIQAAQITVSQNI